MFVSSFFLHSFNNNYYNDDVDLA